jgi:transposase
LNQIQKGIVATKNRIRKFMDFHGLNQGFRAGAWKQRDYARLKDLELPHSLQVSLDVYLRSLAELEAHKQGLQKELRFLSRKERYRRSVAIKDSFPGVGWLTAIRLTLEWGELSRFEGGKELASFVGLTASEYSTGESVHRGRITRQGSGIVRAWLIQCAWRGIRQDPVLLRKFQAVRGNSGSKKKAIVATARKLAVRMRALELSDEPYQLGVLR